MKGVFFASKDLIIESCGLKNQSKIIAYNSSKWSDGRSANISSESSIIATVPSDYFAEGVALYSNLLLLLTYKAQQIILIKLETHISDATTSEEVTGGIVLGSIPYPSWEGWGLTRGEGSSLFASDGSAAVVELDAEILISTSPLLPIASHDNSRDRSVHFSSIFADYGKIDHLVAQYPYVKRIIPIQSCSQSFDGKKLPLIGINELEFLPSRSVDGSAHLYANIFPSARVAKIDIEQGQCVATYDFSSLKRRQAGDILNGLAFIPLDSDYIQQRHQNLRKKNKTSPCCPR